MKKEIINGGFIWHDSLDKYQEALFYKKQAEKTDSGITARQIKSSRQRIAERIKLRADEVLYEKKN